MQMIQNVLGTLGVNMRIISGGYGLVTSWNGSDWADHYAPSGSLGEVLPGDYDMLIIPGGARSHDKLKLNRHVGAFLSGFMKGGKPVATFGDALSLLEDCYLTAGYEMALPQRGLRKLSPSYVEAPYVIDRNLLSIADRSYALKAMEQFLRSRLYSASEMGGDSEGSKARAA